MWSIGRKGSVEFFFNIFFFIDGLVRFGRRKVKKRAAYGATFLCVLI